VKLYHPLIKPPANEYVTESDDPDHLQVYFDMGWEKAPDPEPAEVGRAPEPVRYAPVAAGAEEPSRPAAGAVREEWADWVEHLGGDPDGLTIAELKAKADELEGDASD
jgi:hypothetical protein